MNGVSLDAVELALALSRAPRRLARVRRQALPNGMNLLLRAANQDAALLEQLQAATGARRDEVVEAAWFFIESVLLEPGADSFRNLGLNPDAELEQIKEAHRALIRLVHPDRIRDDWTASYAQRINQAWNVLRNADARELLREQLVQAAQREPLFDATPDELPALFDVGPAVAARRPIPLSPRGLWSAAIGVAALAVVMVYLESTPQRDWSEQSVPSGESSATAAPASPTHPLPPESLGAAPDERTAPAAEFAAARSRAGVDTLPTAAPDAASDSAPAAAAPRAADALANPVSRPDRTDAPAAPASAASLTGTDGAARPPVQRQRSTVMSVPQGSGAPASAALAPLSSTDPAPGGRDAADSASTAAASGQALASTDRDPLPVPAAAAVAATAPGAQDPTRPGAIPPQLSIRDVDRLLASFQDNYRRGDLERMLALFSPDARGVAGGLDTIADDYRKFFAASVARTIAFEDLHIYLRGKEGTATASFVANVTRPSAQRPVVVRGHIQFDLRREGDDVSVSRLLHEESR